MQQGVPTIVGAGGIGGVLAGLMARAGTPVRVVDVESEHVEAINRRGLFVDGASGEFTVQVPALLPAQLSAPLGPVLLAVKSQHTAAAVHGLLPFLGPDTIVVSLQNGVANEGIIAEEVGASRTLGAMVNFAGDYIGPGHVRHGRQGTLYVGEIDGRLSERARAIAAVLSTGVPAYATDNLFGFKWAKECYGAMAGASALVDTTSAEVYSSTPHRRALIRLVEEVAAVARAEGIKLERYESFDPNQIGSETPERLASSHAVLDWVAEKRRHAVKVKTGVWRDLMVRKRKTEVSHTTGAVVKLGRRHGIATPLLEAVLRMIEEIENGQRTMSWSNLDELNEVLGSGF